MFMLFVYDYAYIYTFILILKHNLCILHTLQLWWGVEFLYAWVIALVAIGEWNLTMLTIMEIDCDETFDVWCRVLCLIYFMLAKISIIFMQY